MYPDVYMYTNRKCVKLLTVVRAWGKKRTLYFLHFLVRTVYSAFVVRKFCKKRHALHFNLTATKNTWSNLATETKQ